MRLKLLWLRCSVGSKLSPTSIQMWTCQNTLKEWYNAADGVGGNVLVYSHVACIHLWWSIMWNKHSSCQWDSYSALAEIEQYIFLGNDSLCSPFALHLTSLMYLVLMMHWFSITDLCCQCDRLHLLVVVCSTLLKNSFHDCCSTSLE